MCLMKMPHRKQSLTTPLFGSGQIPESNQNTGKQPKYRKAHINTGKHPNIGVYGGKGMLELLLYVHLKMYLNDSKF